MFPREDALKMGFKSLQDAANWSIKKRKFGGCFEQIDDLFVVYWLPKGHKDVQNFAW